MDNLFGNDDIFSQYNDNFTIDSFDKSEQVYNVEKSMTSLVTPTEPKINATNILRKSEEQKRTKIVPKFGKKIDKTITKKPKKFVPPIKVSVNNSNKQEHNEFTKNQNNSDSYNFPTNVEKSFNSFPDQPDYLNTDFQFLTLSNNVTSNIETTNKELKTRKHDKQNQLDNSISGPKLKQDNSLSNLILGSFNVLNDEELVLSQQNQEFVVPLSTQESGKSSAKNQSFYSVASLKVYKDLDANSFEVKSHNQHKIPEGDDFLNLFRNTQSVSVTKPLAMSIEFGDMGFNMKYSDFVKNFYMDDGENAETLETSNRILEMYPKENKLRFKLKKTEK